MTPVDAFAVEDPTLCDTCGLEACEIHIPGEAARQAKPKRLRVATARDVMAEPPPVEVVEGLAWAGGVSVIVSESGAGKTFVMLNLSAAVGAGLPWHGRYTQEGSVVYVSYEGDALGLRLEALHNQGQRLDHLHIIRAQDPLSPRLTPDGELQSRGELDLIEALGALSQQIQANNHPPITMVIIDTVAASMSGNESATEHVAAYLRAVRRVLSTVPTAAGVLVHHAGWQDGDTQRKRERGSSAWRGNCDGTFYLEAGEYDADSRTADITLRALKVRDGEKPPPLRLIRRRVELLRMNRRGEPVTSCVIERDPKSREDREAEAKRADHELDVKVLRVIVEHPEIATSGDRIRPLVGARKEAVVESIARLTHGRFVLPGGRGKPFRVTEAGRAVVNQAA